MLCKQFSLNQSNEFRECHRLFPVGSFSNYEVLLPFHTIPSILTLSAPISIHCAVHSKKFPIQFNIVVTHLFVFVRAFSVLTTASGFLRKHRFSTCYHNSRKVLWIGAIFWLADVEKFITLLSLFLHRDVYTRCITEDSVKIVPTISYRRFSFLL